MSHKTKIISLSIVCLLIITSVGIYSIGSYLNGNSQLPKPLKDTIHAKFGSEEISDADLKEALSLAISYVDKTNDIQKFGKALYDKKINQSQYELGLKILLDRYASSTSINSENITTKDKIIAHKEYLSKLGVTKSDYKMFVNKLHSAGLISIIGPYFS